MSNSDNCPHPFPVMSIELIKSDNNVNNPPHLVLVTEEALGLLLAPGEQRHVLLRDAGRESSVEPLLVFS